MTPDPRRVAVASRSFSRHPVLRQEVLERFAAVTFNDDGRSLAGDDLVTFLDGHDLAITALEKITDAVLSRLPRLAAIGKYGVGHDMLDLDAMARRGVLLGWQGGVNRRSVSELTIAAMVSVLRHVPLAQSEIRAGGWRQIQGRYLSACTVGIVGLGHVGKDLVSLLRPWGCRLLAHDIRPFPEFCAANGVEAVTLDRLVAEADVVSLHVPLDASTATLMDRARIAAMKPGAVLVNMARGGLVDESALHDALVAGRLSGAALDVLAVEPPVDAALLTLPTVWATPHLGGSAAEAVLAMGRAAIDGLCSARRVEDIDFIGG